jgi:hypothetical protein
MSTIQKMRGVADLLLSQKKYDEAYTILDELYRQIWSIWGTVQGPSTGISHGMLGPRTAGGELLRRQYPEPSANLLCERMHNLNLASMLNEFVQIMRSHLQCINSSAQIRKELSPDSVLIEYAVLYVITLQPAQQRRLLPVFSIATAVVDRGNRLKRIIANHSRPVIEKLLLEYAQKGSNDHTKSINSLLLDYLLHIGDRRTELFKKMSIIVGPSFYRFKYQQYSGQYRTYSRYERYGGYKQYSSSHTFYSATATDEEKNVYYGKLIGLMGKVTKEEIRSKYIGLISLYHPDRVQHLAPEFKELAEMKSKEINAAYDWLRTKYHI